MPAASLRSPSKRPLNLVFKSFTSAASQSFATFSTSNPLAAYLVTNRAIAGPKAFLPKSSATVPFPAPRKLAKLGLHRSVVAYRGFAAMFRDSSQLDERQSSFPVHHSAAGRIFAFSRTVELRRHSAGIPNNGVHTYCCRRETNS